MDLEQALRAVVQVLEPLALERHIALDAKLDDQLREVEIDASKLKQVLFNVIASSLQDARGAGTRSIRALPTDAAAFCVELRDSGPGLPQPVLAQINSPEPSMNGWSATQRMLAALGGRLEAFNDKPSGTVFRIELPRQPSSRRPYLRSV